MIDLGLQLEMHADAIDVGRWSFDEAVTGLMAILSVGAHSARLSGEDEAVFRAWVATFLRETLRRRGTHRRIRHPTELEQTLAHSFRCMLAEAVGDRGPAN
jgi:hypothetical protein